MIALDLRYQSVPSDWHSHQYCVHQRSSKVKITFLRGNVFYQLLLNYIR